MHIEVIGTETISEQARTYAEYRVFAALTHFPDPGRIQRVRVVLRQVTLESGAQSIACVVTVALEGSESFRVRTTAPHAYAAINRAVERITPSPLHFRLSRGFQAEMPPPQTAVDL